MIIKVFDHDGELKRKRKGGWKLIADFVWGLGSGKNWTFVKSWHKDRVFE